jgi:hypothetical protein
MLGNKTKSQQLPFAAAVRSKPHHVQTLPISPLCVAVAFTDKPSGMQKTEVCRRR